MRIAYLVWVYESDEFPILCSTRHYIPCGSYRYVQIVYSEIDE
jgi:hypothetical protein